MKSRASFAEEGSIDDVILIDIDLNSVQEMGNYYDWPHSYHGQLIDVVSSGNPMQLYLMLFLIRSLLITLILCRL